MLRSLLSMLKTRALCRNIEEKFVSICIFVSYMILIKQQQIINMACAFTMVCTCYGVQR